MALSDIAAGIEVTARQQERGVATVDETAPALVDRLRPHVETLPCTPEAAATVVETHAAGTSVGESARAAGITPVAAAKTLHRCGVDGVNPLAPTARRIVRDWLSGDLSRADALALTGGEAAEFALAAYVETHDPDPDLSAAVAVDDVETTGQAALSEAMPDADEYL
jgi:hypothetical protein